MVQNIIVAGKSGAGKQPRIDVLTKEYGLEQLSTGNIFREYLGAYKRLAFDGSPDDFWADGAFVPDAEIEAALKTACTAVGVEPASAVLGLKAARFVDAGLFVPDSITNELFRSAFVKAGGKGLVLDGFPRTPEQSAYLVSLAGELGTKLDLILMVDNDDEAIVARTTGRRICPSKTCGKVFHVEFKPPKDGKYCTQCGTEVILRSDDTEEKIRKRLAEFQAKAKPAMKVLEEAGIPIATVPGNLPVFTDAAVTESVMDVVKPLLG